MNWTLDDLLKYSTEEVLEYERIDLTRQYRASQRLCRDMEQQIKAELVIDHTRLGKDARSCLRAFHTLFELVIRDMGHVERGHNDEVGRTEVSDWFKKPRQRNVGSPQERTPMFGGTDFSGEKCFQHFLDEELSRHGQEGDLLQSGDVEGADIREVTDTDMLDK
jgi:hypothetical protein